MSREETLQDIHSIAFAAINQINYWKRQRGGLIYKPSDLDSLKTAFEGILEKSEELMPKENLENENE